MLKFKRNTKRSKYEFVIQPNKNWFRIDFKELIRYRDLLYMLVGRDFIARYKQTILGPTWFILQPLMMTAVFVVVFNRIAKVSTDNLPPFLFYLCGIMIWNYFANSVQYASNSLIANAEILKKVYFPRLIIPLANVISSLFTFAIQLITFLGFYVYYKYFTDAGKVIDPNISIILTLPLLLIQAAAFALGIGLWIAALTAKYRDLSLLMTFLVQLWMYATPVIYPVSTIPPQWRFIMAFNPMASIVDIYRYAFFGTMALSLKYLVVSIGTTIIVLVTGIFVFNKFERTFVDTL